MRAHAAAALLVLALPGAAAYADRVYVYDEVGRLKEVREIDLQNDPDNCGTLDHVCSTSAPICRMGTCQACARTDSDCDGFDDVDDNCPYRKNRLQEDGDKDGVGDVCDNCPMVTNVDQLNTDGADDGGDACDPDDDNDFCLDKEDDKPKEDSSVVRWRIAQNCPDASRAVYGWDGWDSDGDGVRNCQDKDDDGDMVPDVKDACPIDKGTDALVCQVQPVSCPFATVMDVCQFGGCNELLIQIVSVVYPPLIVEKFTVRGGVLILYPSLQTSLEQMEAALLDARGESAEGKAAPSKAGPLRVEIWSKGERGAPVSLVARVAEYEASTVEQREVIGQSVLLLSVLDNGTIAVQKASVPPPAVAAKER